jgi:hypothetical protein
MAEEQQQLPLDDAALFRQAATPEPPPAPEGQGVPPSPSPPTEKVSAVEGEGGEPTKPEDLVPSWRLREEAEAKRLATERAAKAEQDLQTLIEAIQGDANRQQPKAQEGAPDFFENPQEAVRTIVLEAVKPLAEVYRQQSMALARMYAVQEHSSKALTEAENAFLKAMNDRQLDVMDYEAVVQSPNRYDAVVKWHKKQSALEKYGADPESYFEKTFAEKLKDKAFLEKALEAIRGVASGPSGSSVVQLPPSLSQFTGAAPASERSLAGMGDGELFRYARDSK